MKHRYLSFLLTLACCFYAFTGWSQTTITTTFTNNSVNGSVTFNFENTNSNPVMITGIDGIVGSSGAVNVQAWYKTTATSGAPGIISAANGWAQFGNGSITGIANTATNTTQNFFNNLTLVIPAGAVYSICVSAYTGTNTGCLRYGTASNTIYFQSGNCNLISGGSGVGYAGAAVPAGTALTTTSVGFLGAVTFVNPPACSGIPAATNTLSSSSAVCSGSSFQLSLSNPPFATGINYQWQGSTDNSTWSIIPNATNSTFTTSQAAAAYYRAQISCGTNTIYSTSVQVAMNSALNCYCTATSTNGTFGVYGASNVSFNTLSSSAPVSTTSPYYTSYPAATVTTSVTAGSTYTLSVLAGPSTSVRAWIDWNQNGTYESTESYLLGSNLNSSSATVSTSITVPTTSISAGLTGLRLRTNYYAISNAATDACTTNLYGETKDYQITTILPTPCAGTPTPGSTLSTADSVCSGSSFTLSLQNNPLVTGLTYQWQGSTDGTTWGIITGATNTTYTATQTTAAYYRCQVTCGGNVGYSTAKYVSIKGLFYCYCTATSTGGQGGIAGFPNAYITNVTFNTLNNNSSYPTVQPFFTDYSGSSLTDVYIGLSYPLSVTQGNYSSARAWVDWNHDGVFSATESYSLGNSSNTTLTVTTTNITIPSTAIAGLTKLRIRTNYNSSSFSSSDACTTLAYGETEDYAITVYATPACSGTPTPGNTVSSVDSACSGLSFTLSLQNAVTVSGLTFQWQSSANGTTWSNISSATASTYVVSQTAATYYRCMVSCGSNTATATAKLVYMNVIGNCYCTPVSYTGINTLYYTLTNVTFNTLSNNTANNFPSGSPFYINFPASVVTTAVNVNTSYTLTVTAGYQAIVRAWFDWNHNGSLEASESYLVGTNAGSSYANLSTTITVPSTALGGLTRMRMRTNFYGYGLGAADACTGTNNGESEDYTITVVPATACSGMPTPGVVIAGVDSACSARSFNLSVQNNTIGSGVSYQWQLSTDGTNWTGIFNATASTYSTSQTIANYYRCQVTCSGNTATTPALFIPMKTSANCYCIPGTVGGTSGIYTINNVSIGALNSTTTYSTATPYYTYYSSPATNLVIGNTYTLSVSLGNNTNARAWIDWNQNGEFEATEAYLTTSGSPVSQSVTVPATAFTGNTRLRVRDNASSGTIGNTDACSAFSDGETKDYLLYVSTVPLALGVKDISVVNTGGANRVNWTTAKEDKGDYFILERSVDGATFTALATINAKGQPSGYVYNDEKPVSGLNYYRVKMVNNDETYTYSKTVSAFVKSTSNISLEAYPNPTNGLVSVNVLGDKAENGMITISDITGNVVSRAAIDSGSITVDISSFPAGIYLIKYTDNSHLQVIKLMKR